MDVYLLLASLGLSLYLMGVHWTFQLVHFPLLTRVGVNEFQDYQTSHQKRVLWTARIPRVIALGLAIVLILLEPWGISLTELYIYSGTLLLATVISYFFIRPLQSMLSKQGYSTKMILTMTRLYWTRTLLSTAGAMILLVIVAKLLGEAL